MGGDAIAVDLGKSKDAEGDLRKAGGKTACCEDDGE